MRRGPLDGMRSGLPTRSPASCLCHREHYPERMGTVFARSPASSARPRRSSSRRWQREVSFRRWFGLEGPSFAQPVGIVELGPATAAASGYALSSCSLRSDSSIGRSAVVPLDRDGPVEWLPRLRSPGPSWCPRRPRKQRTPALPRQQPPTPTWSQVNGTLRVRTSSPTVMTVDSGHVSPVLSGWDHRERYAWASATWHRTSSKARCVLPSLALDTSPPFHIR